jgi:hypothetical protein
MRESGWDDPRHAAIDHLALPIEVDPGGAPRFNMPMEPGIHLGARLFGQGRHRRKKALILEAERRRSIFVFVLMVVVTALPVGAEAAHSHEFPGPQPVGELVDFKL